jgi:hypothetical protein
MTLLRSLWPHKTSLEHGMFGYSTNHCDESFFVTKFSEMRNIVMRSARNIINK